MTIKVTYQIINFVKYYEIYYGRGSYAVITIKDYEKLTATKALFDELKKGEHSAKEKGWLSIKDVRAMAGL